MTKKWLLLIVVCTYGFYSIAQQEKSGFFNLTRIGYHNITNIERTDFIANQITTDALLESSGAYALSINNITGYYLNTHFSAGMGLGLDQVANPSLKALPIFLDLRGYLRKTQNTAFAYFNLGPTITIKNKDTNFHTGGILNIGAGFQYKLTGTILALDVAYNLKNLEMPVTAAAGTYTSYKVEAMSLNIGIIFN